MVKYFSLFLIFLLLAGGICAVGKKTVASSRCTVKQEGKTVKARQVSQDIFKAKYWVISAIFRQ